MVHMLDLANIESNCMRRRLDRNGIRRGILNFCCIHIQMMLRTISRKNAVGVIEGLQGKILDNEHSSH